MQNQNHQHHTDDKFAMNFNAFDPELFSAAHMGQMGGMNIGMKRSAQDAGLDREPGLGLSSDDDQELMKKEIMDKQIPHGHGSARQDLLAHHQTSLEPQQQQSKSALPNGKKTKGRVKIKMEFIDNKLRRYTTFSKRKTGIMKKAYELSTLTGTQVMLLVASETGHVYTFATRKLQPMITSEAGKALIQTCLNSPDPPQSMSHHHHHDQRMSATGFEETELTYAVNEEEHKVRQMMYSSPLNSMHQGNMASPSHHAAAAAAAAAAALSNHHHHQQYHHPQAPPTPHLTPPTSTSYSHHHHLSSSTPPNHDHTGVTHLQHPHLGGHQTPLPSHSPLPPHSPMGTSSPTSPYPGVHHHPHHHIAAHSR